MTSTSSSRSSLACESSELLYVVHKFLVSINFDQAAKALKEELDKRNAFPVRTDVYNNTHPVTYDEFDGRFGALVPADFLLRICRRLRSLQTAVLPPPFSDLRLSLLAAGNQSLVRTTNTTLVKWSRLAPLSADLLAARRGRPLCQPRQQRPKHRTLISLLFARQSGLAFSKAQIMGLGCCQNYVVQKRILGHLSMVFCVTFDRTQEYVITGADDNLVKIWSLRSGTLRQTLRGSGAEIADLSVSQENSLLAAACVDRLVRVWALASGVTVAVLAGHAAVVNTVAFLPFVDGDRRYLVSTGNDCQLAFWPFSVRPAPGLFDAGPPIKFHERASPGAHLSCEAHSPAGTLLAVGGSDKLVRLYRLVRGHQPVRLGQLEAHTDKVDSLAWSHLGLRFASASKDGTAKVWRFQQQHWRPIELILEPALRPAENVCPNQQSPAAVNSTKVTMVQWSGDDVFVVTAASDLLLRVYLSADGSLQRRLAGHADEVYSLTAHPLLGAVLLSAGHDGLLCLWQLDEGRRLVRHHNAIDGGHGALFDARFGPRDGAQLAAVDSHGQLTLLALGSNAGARRAPAEQFFNTDYRPLVRDAAGHVLDEQCQLAPHLMGPPLLVDAQAAPYGAELQRLVPGRERLATPDAQNADAPPPAEGAASCVWTRRQLVAPLSWSAADAVAGRLAALGDDEYEQFSRQMETAGPEPPQLVRSEEPTGPSRKDAGAGRNTTRRRRTAVQDLTDNSAVTSRPPSASSSSSSPSSSSSLAEDDSDSEWAEEGQAEVPTPQREERKLRKPRTRGAAAKALEEEQVVSSPSPSSDDREEEEHRESANGRTENDNRRQRRARRRVRRRTEEEEPNSSRPAVPLKRKRPTASSSGNGQQQQKKARSRVPTLSASKRDILESTPLYLRTFPGWMSHATPRRFPYFPQIGDQVVYLHQGHRQMLDKVRELNWFKADEQVLGLRSDLATEEFCNVVAIRFFRKPQRLIGLWLEQLDAGTLASTGLVFAIKFLDVNQVPDFVILKQHYDKAMAKRWRAGDRVQILMDDSWWAGRVEDIASGDGRYPRSKFANMHIEYDSGDVDLVSAWDLEPCDEGMFRAAGQLRRQRRHYPASEADVARLAVYEPNPDEHVPAAKWEAIAWAVTQLGAMEEFRCFVEPVNTDLYFDYARQIDYPSCLDTILQRIHSRFYRRPAALEFDVKFVAFNALVFNQEGSDIVRNAQLLCETLFRLIRTDELVGSEEELVGLLDETRCLPAGQRTDFRRPPCHTPPAAAAAPQAHCSAAGFGGRRREEWERRCTQLLEAITATDLGQRFCCSDDVEASAYLDSSSNLEVIASRLSQSYYTGPDMLKMEIDNLLMNCRASVNKRTQIFKDSLELQNRFSKALAEEIDRWRRRHSSAGPPAVPAAAAQSPPSQHYLRRRRSRQRHSYNTRRRRSMSASSKASGGGGGGEVELLALQGDLAPADSEPEFEVRVRSADETSSHACNSSSNDGQQQQQRRRAAAHRVRYRESSSSSTSSDHSSVAVSSRGRKIKYRKCIDL